MDTNEKALAAALDAYQRQRANFDQARASLASITSSVTSPRREVTATVGHVGELTEISFPTSAYKRMTPVELGAVIVRTVGAAREKSVTAAADVMAPMLPPSLSARDLMSGKVDADALFSAGAPRSGEGA
ncbi:YbaB/EbfC family nucleoid-associated protein [Kutzneria chonburiensis]|uniref:YbaB/EbfC family nucleoid-associated protein n=1 Tax=Kutzneria chonburiensis TaxID=1483604 RepID=A0ABV6N5N8_9PSEU|nr:YbaB/EbfC family nucleoid-associated protein [Kutzneria chonburiensis]